MPGRHRFERTAQALCRYCTRQSEKGRVQCLHCHGYRLPSRREARRAGKRAAG